MKYIIIGYCKDCTGIDSMGCNEGQPFDLGETDDFETAKKIAKNHANDCSPYYSEIIDKKLNKTIWTTQE